MLGIFGGPSSETSLGFFGGEEFLAVGSFWHMGVFGTCLYLFSMITKKLFL